jgi:hypothetical protein
MDTYLTDLITRMLDESDQIMEDGFESSKTISWKALREAEKLTEEHFVPQLIQFIETEKNKKKRREAYFILGHITKNTGNLIAPEFLISRIDKESDKYIISSLLDRISAIQKPGELSLLPIIAATKSEKWLIRYSAIKALKLSNNEMAEERLIEIIATSEDAYDLSCANSTLYSIGTPKALPYLEKHLQSRKRDVKASAKNAIEEINKRHLTAI